MKPSKITKIKTNSGLSTKPMESTATATVNRHLSW